MEGSRMPINKTQIKLIHIAIRKLRLSDEEYRKILLIRYFAVSSKELTYDEAHDLIEYFKTMGFKIITRRHEKKKFDDNVVTLVSKQQLSIIEHLKQDIKWRMPDGYNRWLKTFLKKERIMTSRDASKVIEALKAMRERQQMQEVDRNDRSNRS